MIRYCLWRTVSLVATLLVASILIYGSLYLAPGSPLSFIVGGHFVSPRALAALSAQYHLNDSFPVAYWHWLAAVAHGDFGRSVISQEPVWSLIRPRLLTTGLLIGYSAILLVIGGVGAGVVAGLHPRRLGPMAMTVATIGMAIPSFVAAVLLVTVFGLDLGWFPVLGAGSGVGGRISHLTLPAVALALYLTAYVARITRVAVSEELEREHVETARARGLPERVVVRRHVLRNAWIPVSTVVGVAIVALVAGDAVVEQAFGLNGIGQYLVQAVEAKDFPVVQAIMLLLVCLFVVVSMLVDLGYVLADPRVRRARQR